MSKTEKAIAELGWDCYFVIGSGYRAGLGSFFTPFRETPELVLADVRAMKSKPEAKP